MNLLCSRGSEWVLNLLLFADGTGRVNIVGGTNLRGGGVGGIIAFFEAFVSGSKKGSKTREKII